MIKLIKGDCLEKMKEIEGGSVDLILTDPPYGTVKGAKFYEYAEGVQWDNIINFTEMWDQINRVLRKNGKCILFSQEPFTSNLIKSAIPNVPFSYRNIWLKDNFANALLVNKAPVNYYEDICVFSKITENNTDNEVRDYLISERKKVKEAGFKDQDLRIMCGVSLKGGGLLSHYWGKEQWMMPTKEKYNLLQSGTGCFNRKWEDLNAINEVIKKQSLSIFNLWQGKKYKSNVFEYKKDYDGYHPTQKPILLLEDLIKTYSNENDTILDFTMGSGSTGVACVNTNRKFIGIELDDKYFDIAKKRIEECSNL